MVILHSKLFKSAGMALVTAVLLLSAVPAMAWSYGHYGGHHYGYYGSYYKPYRSHHYGSYYRHYPYYRSSYRRYRRNSYSEPDYASTNSHEYSSAVATSSTVNTVNNDHEQGWTLLAGGEQRSALKTFSTQAQNDPKNGTLKVGFALATAETGDLDRGVWAMRRAVRIDPDALHYLTLDKNVQGIVKKLIHRYEDDGYHTLEATDRDFMIASLYYLLHNADAADQVLSDQDTHTSAQNLDRLIQQMRADDAGGD